MHIISVVPSAIRFYVAEDEIAPKCFLSMLRCQNPRWPGLVIDASGGNGGHHATADALCLTEPLLKLYLLGVRIDANVLQGIWQMTRQGDPLTAAMVLFCVVGAPLVLVAAIAYLWFGNILGMNLRPVLLMLEKLKEWVMLDIYLVGIGVASIKVQDYAFLQPGIGLFAFISLVLLSILTLIHLNVEQLWERFYPQRPATRPDENLRVCLGCHYTGFPDKRGRCPRCHIPLRLRRNNSLQSAGRR